MLHIAFGLLAVLTLLGGMAMLVIRRSVSERDVLVPTRVFDFPMDRVIDV